MVKWIGIIIIAGVLIYFMTKLDTHIGEDYVKDNNEKKDNTYYLIEGDSPEKVDLKYAGKIGNSNYNSFTSNCEEKGSEVYRYNDSFIVVFGKKVRHCMNLQKKDLLHDRWLMFMEKFI